MVARCRLPRGCRVKAKVRGLCRLHYLQWLEAGHLEREREFGFDDPVPERPRWQYEGREHELLAAQKATIPDKTEEH